MTGDKYLTSVVAEENVQGGKEEAVVDRKANIFTLRTGNRALSSHLVASPSSLLLLRVC